MIAVALVFGLEGNLYARFAADKNVGLALMARGCYGFHNGVETEVWNGGC